MTRFSLTFFLLLFGLAAAATAADSTLEFTAAEFAETDAGAVPYYFDKRRMALAVNAAVVEYRNKFARASITFTGDAGTYTVVIKAMRETDGDCTYRLFVNDELIGTGTNGETEVDYAPQEHHFTGVEIPAGAKLSVESNAVTNGKIPEGDGTAFARGRWTALAVDPE